MGKRRRDSHREVSCMSKTPGLKDFWYPWNLWPTMKTFTIWCGVAIEMSTFLSTILTANMEHADTGQRFQGMHKCSSGVPYHLGGEAKVMEFETAAPQIQVNLSCNCIESYPWHPDC